MNQHESAASTAVQKAKRDDICGVFCDAVPSVSFTDFRGIQVHRCSDCYEKPCTRCRGDIKDKYKPKGLCEGCREEIRNQSKSQDEEKISDRLADQSTLTELEHAF